MKLQLQHISEEEWQRLAEKLVGYGFELYSIVEHTPGGWDTQFSVRLMRTLDTAGWQITGWMGNSGPTTWDHLTIKRSESSSGAEKLANWMCEQGLTVNETVVTQPATVEIEFWKG